MNGSICSGKANFKSFYTDAANALKFPVYCPVLAPDWWGQEANYTGKNYGLYDVFYTNARHYMFEMVGGNICGTTNDCSKPFFGGPGVTAKGKVWMADLGAYFYVLHPITVELAGKPALVAIPNIYVAWAPYGKHTAYVVAGMGMSEAGFKAQMKSIIKVAKS